jgi:hypothetical protein
VGQVPGRKDFTHEEIDRARAAVNRQLAAYRTLAAAVTAAGDEDAATALAELEPIVFDHMVLALDRFFVAREREVTGTATTPLDELELLAGSVMVSDGVLRTDTEVAYDPGAAVLGLQPGDRLTLTADRFEELADAVLSDLEARLVG